MKLSDFKTFAKGNGIPCNGDLIESVIDGTRYRAEFYVEDNFGHPCVMLAGDSAIERFNGSEWEAVIFTDDDSFNELFEKITPKLEVE